MPRGSRASRHESHPSLRSLQAWRVVPEPQVRRCARRAALRLHVPLVERAQALVRPGVPTPSADDGGGAGAGGGAEGGGRGTRHSVPARTHAPDEQARVQAGVGERVYIYRECVSQSVTCVLRERDESLLYQLWRVQRAGRGRLACPCPCRVCACAGPALRFTVKSITPAAVDRRVDE